MTAIRIVLSKKNVNGYNVPQGSIPSPELFSKISLNWMQIFCMKNKVDPHLYADDSESFANFKPNDQEDVAAVVATLESCKNIKVFMCENLLQLSESITEGIIFEI